MFEDMRSDWTTHYPFMAAVWAALPNPCKNYLRHLQSRGEL